ncbi:hypothetical protein [Pseudonocardia sp.]
MLDELFAQVGPQRLARELGAPPVVSATLSGTLRTWITAVALY